MVMLQKVDSKEIWMGRLPYGADLLEGLTGLCLKNDIRLGRIEALGAVQKARLGYYHQDSREYEFFLIDRPMEITKLIGNVSMKDGQSMVHAHVTLADEEGKAFGGHLASGTTVFACEFIIESFEGPVFDRKFDPQTGLLLWAEES